MDSKSIILIILPIISILGLLATASLITIFRRPRDIPNVPDRKYLLSLLSSCLIILLIVFPFGMITQVLGTFPFGVIVCKLLEFATVFSLGIVCFTLVAISVASFLKVRGAFYCINSNVEKLKEKHRSFYAVLAIWIIAALCGIPAIIFSDEVNGYMQCNQYFMLTEENHINYNLASFYVLVYYIIPVCLMIIFYLLIGAYLIGHNIGDVPAEERGEAKKRLLEGKRITLIGLFILCLLIILHLPAAITMVVMNMEFGIINTLSYPCWNIFFSALPLGLYLICPELRERFRNYFLHFGSKIKKPENEETVVPTTISLVKVIPEKVNTFV